MASGNLDVELRGFVAWSLVYVTFTFNRGSHNYRDAFELDSSNKAGNPQSSVIGTLTTISSFFSEAKELTKRCANIIREIFAESPRNSHDMVKHITAV